MHWSRCWRRFALVACALCVGRARAAELVVAADQLSLRSTGAPCSDGGWNLATLGQAATWVHLPSTGPHRFWIAAAGTEAGGVWPQMQVTVTCRNGNAPAIAFDELVSVEQNEPAEFAFTVDVPPGDALVSVTFPHGALSDQCDEDCNLLLKQFRFEDAVQLNEPPSWWYPLGNDGRELRRLTSAGILRHRMAKLTVETRPNAEVEILQQRHAFEFGVALRSAMFDRDADRLQSQRYLRTIDDNFNAAVHENALKWLVTDPQSGAYDFEMAGRIFRWCRDRDISVRGHCIFTAVPDQVPAWVQHLPDSELREAIKDRAITMTSFFRGNFSEFDVNNEMLQGSYFADRLGPAIRADMFRWARQGNPHAVLYVNENGILSEQGVMTGLYVRQIRDLLRHNAPVGGIGCQGHFRDELDPNHLQRTLDLLAQFDLPIKVTAYDYLAPNEEAKARHLEELFRVCFAHPCVRGIYLSGFWEGAHCRSDAALWTNDWSPTPAANMYRHLVFNEWWTDFRGRADEHGVCRARVFHGTHQIRIDGQIVKELVVPAGTQDLQLRAGI